MNTMIKMCVLMSVLFSPLSSAESDTRQLVEMPGQMQQHMMSNMRNHLESINAILLYLGKGEMDKAADIAEQRLGMSSLDSHGASHLATFMPQGMREAGIAMHRKASRFALKAQEGDLLLAYRMLSEITSACVVCHAGYRIR